MIYCIKPSKPKWWMGKVGGRLWVIMPFNLLFRLFRWVRNG